MKIFRNVLIHRFQSQFLIRSVNRMPSYYFSANQDKDKNEENQEEKKSPWDSLTIFIPASLILGLAFLYQKMSQIQYQNKKSQGPK